MISISIQNDRFFKSQTANLYPFNLLILTIVI